MATGPSFLEGGGLFCEFLNERKIIQKNKY